MQKISSYNIMLYFQYCTRKCDLKIKELISYLQNLPAGILFKKAFNYIFKKNYDKTLKYYKVERRNETVHISPLSLFKIPTHNITPFPSFQHFDLLGSGWIKNNYSSKPIGLERYRHQSNLSIPSFDKDGNWLSQVVLASHLDFSKSCWKLIQRLNSDYNPIDWQKDFKSGFRWSSKHWFRAQRKLMAGKKDSITKAIESFSFDFTGIKPDTFKIKDFIN